jgi:mycofactocin system glycosyltransferase
VAGNAPPLPSGFRLVLDPAVRRLRPEVLVGGWPTRVLRLRGAGRDVVDRWSRGDPVGRGSGEQALARRLLDAGIVQPRPEPGSGPGPAAVTVVIPVRDRPDGLAATLAALGDFWSVVVVDDGSSAPVAAGRFALIRHDAPLGPAAARNRGWRAAQTEVVAFVDADCELEPGCLPRLLPHLADPAVGAVAPRIRSKDPEGTAGWLPAYEQRRSSLDLGPMEAPVRPGSVVAYAPTATLVVRREALEDVGGFDEALRYGEDVDLVWRLGQRGWRVRYEPAARVAHPARADVGQWLRQRYQYGRSTAPLAARHGRAVTPIAVSPWSAAAWVLAAGGHPVAGTALAVATSVALARRAGPDLSTARTLAALAIQGNLRAGGALAQAIRRAWLPPALVWAVTARRVGPLAAAFAIPPLVEWATGHAGGLRPLTWLLARDADDLAYQTGVWAGVIETRSGAALLPDW